MKDATILTPAQALNMEFTLPDAGNAANQAIHAALRFCASKMRLPDEDAARTLVSQGDGNARGYFEYALARELAEHIGALDDKVQAVYLYDPEATPEDDVFTDAAPTLVHLVVWAQHRTGALHSLLAALDRAVTQRYAELLDAPDQLHLLDVQVVDDAEVNSRSGFGAMLNSLYHRPLMVWKR